MPLSERVSLGAQLLVVSQLRTIQPAELEIRPDLLRSAREISFVTAGTNRVDAQGTLEQFLQSPLVAETYEKILHDDRLYRPIENEGKRSLTTDMAGACFQYLAWSYFLQQRSVDTVLSPESTRMLFKKIFQDAQESKKPLGLDTFHDLVLPDGVVIDSEAGNIRELVEYSLVRDKNYFRAKVRAHRELRQELPFLFGDATIVFVVPDEIQILAITADDDVEFLSMPISHRAFGEAINRLYTEFTYAEDSATLVDIRARMYKQSRRQPQQEPQEDLSDY